jgi:membrane-bound lytic murein transglycosylase A
MMRFSPLQLGIAGTVLALLAACTAPVTRPTGPARPTVPTTQPPVEQPPTTSTTPPPPQLRYEAADWNSLPGWKSDDIGAAWPALLTSCRATRMAPVWTSFCDAAKALPATDAAAQRRLIETRLKPWRVTTISRDGKNERVDSGIVTGYYEPVVNGSRKRGGVYQTPIYAVPDDLLTIDLGDMYPQLKGERIRGKLNGKRVVPYPDRAALADGKLLAGKEIAFLDSAVDAFFLQIQGSGRVRLNDGTVLRVAYADVNGQPYRSIGRYLVDKGEMTLEQVALPTLKMWLAANPARANEIFNANPSVVFFQEEKLGDPTIGPRGALGYPLTAGRSMAVDPRMLPLGAPFFLSTLHPLTRKPLQRLMLGQDTGGAIRGAIRGDFFWGLGAEAGEAAGAMREQGAFWLLWPTDQPLPVPAP